MDKTSSGFDADSAQVSRWLWAVRIATILSFLSSWSWLYSGSAHANVAGSFIFCALPFVGILFAMNSARWRLTALGMAVGGGMTGMALQSFSRSGENPSIGPLFAFLAPQLVLIATALISWGFLWRDPRADSTVLIRWFFFLCFPLREPRRSATSAAELTGLFAMNIGIGVAVSFFTLISTAVLLSNGEA
jgi:hypothetical protein